VYCSTPISCHFPYRIGRSVLKLSWRSGDFPELSMLSGAESGSAR
jgi:hypothetical protein